MGIRQIVRIVPTLIVVGSVVAACHDPEGQLPTSPSAPTLVSLEIIGPSSVAPGQSVQFVANAHMSDGAAKAVSGAGRVAWHSSNTAILDMAQSGVATGRPIRGEVVVSATVTMGKVTRQVERSMLVLPTGTFRLVGTVREDESPNLPVPAVTVETTNGDPSTTTDSSGQYRLYGVPSTADIRVSRPGYATQVRSVTLSANSTENFLVALDGPRLGLNGNYTLTLDAGSGCQANTFWPNLPASLRHRTYDATIAQAGSVLTVFLTESRFRLNSLGLGNRFTGQALGGSATFTFTGFEAYYYPYYGPTSYPVAEALPDGTYFVPEGDVTTTGTASGLSGTLSGALVQWDRNFPASNSRQIGFCFGSIQFSLTQR